MTATTNGASSTLPDDGSYDVGKFPRAITTNSAEAQRWFDRDLLWSFGFNVKEASECFVKGLAFIRGPYYNQNWKLFDAKQLAEVLEMTYNASQEALKRQDNTTPIERALIRAIAARHPSPSPPEDLGTWSSNYTDAMQQVYEQFKNDIDVAALYADALMVLTPWTLWDIHTGNPAKYSRALAAKAALEHAFTLPGSNQHPGLLHLHIHLMEMSSTPEVAVPSANNLRHIAPDAGHLNHMPSHIDVLVGDYDAVIAANRRAIVADGMYLKKTGGMNMYTFYRVHDFHSLIYVAMLYGQSQVALDNCSEMEASLSEELLSIESPPMADWMDFSTPCERTSTSVLVAGKRSSILRCLQIRSSCV